MDHATQVALMRRIFRFLDEGTTEMAAAEYRNPVTAYIAPERLERERQLLFRGYPLFLCLSTDLSAQGAYLTADIAGYPLLLVRGRGGGLRAFLNVCRHRGAQVASGEGTSDGRFSCPYHGWTYDDQGHLVAQPCPEAFSHRTGDSGLQPIAVGEKHGLVFVRPGSGEAFDVDACLGGAQRELEPLGLDGYVRFARQAVQRGINWKLAIDTFLEAYHVSALHARSLGPAILGTPAAWDAFGQGSRMIAVRRTITGARELPEAQWDLLRHAVVLYNLFPNTMLIHQIDHVEVVQAYPGAGGADSAEIVFSLYTPEAVTTAAARRHFQANFDLLLAATNQEDFRLCEGIQRGFHADPGGTVVYGRNEPGVAHYQRAVRAALGLDPV